MADVSLIRGGSPVLKTPFCKGHYAQFTPPFETPVIPGAPPYDSYSEAANMQGYTNLHFPLVPHLLDTDAHKWMQHALKSVSAVGDRIELCIVPSRAYLQSLHIEVADYDDALTGVYVTPAMYRVYWDFTAGNYAYTKNTAFAAELTTAGMGQFPLGTPQPTDTTIGMALLSTDPTILPPSYTHTKFVRNASGVPTAYAAPVANGGHNIIALDVTAGDADKIKKIYNGKFRLYLSVKLLTFAGSAQIG